MKKTLLFLIFLGIFTPSLCVRAETDKYIEFDVLYSSPQSYENLNVELIGYLELHIEGNTLCASGVDSNCLLLKLKDVEKYSRLNNKKVIVEGTFKPVDINYEREERVEGKLVIQFGPYYHELHNITKMAAFDGNKKVDSSFE